MAARTDRHDEALLALLYDELPPAEAEAMRRELAAEAPEVLDRLDDYRHIREVAAELPDHEPDPQMHYDLLRAARLAAEPDRKPSRFWAIVESLSWTPAIAGLLLVVVAAGLTARLSDEIGEGAPAGAEAPAADDPRAGAKAPVVTPGAVTKSDTATPKDTAKAAAGERIDDKRTADPRPAPEADAPAAAPADGLDAFEDRAAGKGAAPPVALDAARREAAAPPVEKKKAPFGKSRTRTAPKPAPSKRKKAASPLGGNRGGDIGDALAVPDQKPAPPPTDRKAGEPRFAPPPAPEAVERDTAAKAERVEPTLSVGDATRDLDDSADDRVAPAEPEKVTLDAVQTGAGGSTEGGTAVRGAEAERAADTAPRRAAAQAPSAPVVDEVTDGVVAEAEEEAEQVKEARTVASPSAVMLDRARGARARGDHRTAVGLYEEYLRDGGGADLDRVRFEAAQSYEALGQTDRAVQLYRLVAQNGGAFADAARGRVEAMARVVDSPPAKKSAPARPSPTMDFESVEPASQRE